MLYTLYKYHSWQSTLAIIWHLLYMHACNSLQVYIVLYLKFLTSLTTQLVLYTYLHCQLVLYLKFDSQQFTLNQPLGGTLPLPVSVPALLAGNAPALSAGPVCKCMASWHCNLKLVSRYTCLVSMQVPVPVSSLHTVYLLISQHIYFKRLHQSAVVETFSMELI